MSDFTQPHPCSIQRFAGPFDVLRLPRLDGRSGAQCFRGPLVLRNHQSPGDIVALTAAVRDLHRAAGGRFMLQVQTACPAIWEQNSYVKIVHNPGQYAPGSRVIECQYPLIHRSNQVPRHFIEAFHEHLAQKLEMEIPITAFRGDIHLSAHEKGWTGQIREMGHEGPYWIMMEGGKYDFTAKWWNPDFYQAVVDHFRGRLTFAQCGEKDHWHPPLKGVVNLIGKTDARRGDRGRSVNRRYGRVNRGGVGGGSGRRFRCR